jgi:hypothetical protein
MTSALSSADPFAVTLHMISRSHERSAGLCAPLGIGGHSAVP